jgi:large subunit ribosomal protein L29
MKAADIRGMNEMQVEKQLTDLHTEWRNLRFQEAVGQLTHTARIRQIRKDIARIHTVRTEREIDAALSAVINADVRG